MLGGGGRLGVLVAGGDGAWPLAIPAVGATTNAAIAPATGAWRASWPGRSAAPPPGGGRGNVPATAPRAPVGEVSGGLQEGGVGGSRSSWPAGRYGGRVLGWRGRVVPASAAVSRSSGQRRQDHGWIPTFAAVLSSTFLGAYGVSCRARVNVYATPQMWRFAPAVEPHWVPRSVAPWDQGFGTNGGQPNRFVRKMRCTCRNSHLGLDGRRREGRRNRPGFATGE